LGELTGLTTGAVTSAIDRLEKAGDARRANDPKDRRLTIVEPTRNKKYKKKIEIIFAPLHERMCKLLSSYSEGELAFLLNATTVITAQTQ
jgi:DNA-binding MarR family transcriptional regulator